MNELELDPTTDDKRIDPLRAAEKTNPDFTLSFPLSIPGYLVVSQIGSGGMGVVYCARQIALDRVVALKTVNATRQNSPVALARFIREAKVMAGLRHPNVVTAFDSGECDGLAYYTMELLDGCSLDARLRGLGGRVEERFAWQVVRQAAAGLAEAEAQGIIHRDIKPGNIFLVPAPTGYPLPPGIPLVKVTDFGLASFREHASHGVETRLTQAGTIIGTPVYMAPEQFGPDEVDARADIYALGVTAYEMLAGQAPFRGLNVWEIIEAKRGGAWCSGNGISPGSQALIRAMTRTERDERIGTYAELLVRVDDLLDRLEKNLPLVEEPPRPAPLRRGRWVIGLIACIAAVAVGAFVLGRSKTLRHPDDYRPQTLSNVLNKWVPNGGNGPWKLDIQGDGYALTGNGVMPLPLSAGDVQLTVLIDTLEADVVEVQFAISAAGPRMAVRISKREGVCVGRLSGAESPFQQLTGWMGIRPSGDPEERREVSVQLERLGDGWFVTCNGNYLGGWPDDGSPKVPQFNLCARGGDARFTEITTARMVRTKGN